MIEYSGSGNLSALTLEFLGDGATTAVDIDLSKAPFNLSFGSNYPSSSRLFLIDGIKPTGTLKPNGILSVEFPTPPPPPSAPEYQSPRTKLTLYLWYGGPGPAGTSTSGLSVEGFSSGVYSGPLTSNIDSTSANFYLDIENSAITSASFPDLINYDGYLSLSFNPQLASVSFPKLAQVSGNQGMWLNNNALTGAIDFPLLTTLQGQIRVHNNPALNQIGLTALSAVEANSWLIANGCALTVTAVNDILIKFDATKTGTGTINLSGGTSAVPSGAGVTAKNSLIAAGWSVTTN